MDLKVYCPIGIVLEKSIQKIDFQALDGYFTLLPKHVDFVTALTPNIVRFTDGEQITFMACNRGILTKIGNQFVLSAHKVVVSHSLSDLEQTIAVEFKQDDEQRKEINTVMARLEVGLSRGFMKLKEESTHAPSI